MVNKKRKKNIKYLKGGDINNSSLSPTPNNNSNMFSMFSNVWNQTKKSTEGLINKSKIAFNDVSQKTNNLLKRNSNPTNLSGANPTSNFPNKGGKKSRKYKGGNLSNNSSYVHNLKVAKPTYWIKGGKTKRKRKIKTKTKKNRFHNFLPWLII